MAKTVCKLLGIVLVIVGSPGLLPLICLART